MRVTLLESQCFLDAALLVVLSKMRGGKTAHQLAVQAPAQRRAGPRAHPFTKGFAKSTVSKGDAKGSSKTHEQLQV